MKTVFINYEILKEKINLTIETNHGDANLFFIFGDYSNVHPTRYKDGSMVFTFIDKNNKFVHIDVYADDMKNNVCEWSSKNIHVLSIPNSKEHTNLDNSCELLNDQNLNRNVYIDEKFLEKIIMTWSKNNVFNNIITYEPLYEIK